MVKARMTVEKKSESARRFCGNCYYHDVYEYPDFMFCCIQYEGRNNPIVSTLGTCEHWKPALQDCFCVEEALRKRGQKSADFRKE